MNHSVGVLGGGDCAARCCPARWMCIALVAFSMSCGRVYFETPARDGSSNMDGSSSMDGSSNMDGSMDAALPSCTDGVRNQNETGVDCGGVCIPCYDCTAVTTIPQVECDALVAFYRNTNGMGWTDRTGWLSAPDPCSWVGITCGPANVTAISLQANNVAGAVGPEIGALTELEIFDLDGNSIAGSIPSELGSLSQLRVIDLDNNQLSGAIPVGLGNLTQLIRFDLSYNNIGGNIPGSLGNLTALTRLTLHRNQLQGSIPASLGGLTGLTALNLRANQLDSAIPAELGNLTSCDIFNLAENQLSGTVPSTLASVPGGTTFLLRGQSGCLSTPDNGFATLLDSRDPQWNDGCP